MIELNIPPKVAVNLLVDRMRFECDHRSIAGLYQLGTQIEHLPFEEVFDIACCAAHDLISLLPLGVFTEKSNLFSVIIQAMKSLSDVFGFDEFRLFSVNNAKSLIAPMRDSALKYTEQEQFGQN